MKCRYMIKNIFILTGASGSVALISAITVPGFVFSGMRSKMLLCENLGG